MPVTLERLLTFLKSATRFIQNEGITLPGLWFILGTWHEENARHDAAILAYTRALNLADRSSSQRMFLVRQRWQFRLERQYYLRGTPRVEDPLFECRADPDRTSRCSTAQRQRSPGHYEAYWDYRGLRIDGFLSYRVRECILRVYLGERLLRELTIVRNGWAPPHFQLTLTRPTIAACPASSTLRLELADGRRLLCEGCAQVSIAVPHGTGSIDQAGNGGDGTRSIDKKGFLVEHGQSRDSRQSQMLELYSAAMSAFMDLFDRHLMLLYGTLLGQVRSRDFIPGDDDFDVGYVSLMTSPEAVKVEAKDIALRLVRAGFVVSFNRSGRLFRLRRPGDEPKVHLDVHPVWFEPSGTWIHPRAHLSCRIDDFLPASQGTFRGAAAYLPGKPEAFLAAYYGPGWRVPDPAYSTAARRFPRHMRRHLARAFVTPAEYAEMQAALAAQPAPAAAGRLISIGSHSLYPLAEYERTCDW